MKVFKNIEELPDKEFTLYFELLISILNKFGDDALIHDGDWYEFRDFYSLSGKEISEFKNSRLNFSGINSKQHFEEYVYFENDVPAGWAAFKIYDEKCELMFDLINDEINENVFREILNLSAEYMDKKNYDSISFWTHNERKDKAIQRNGSEPEFTMYISKLAREDMNPDYWKEIVRNNKEAEKYSLVFCHEIPEENYDEYIRFKNEINIDLNKNNPNGSVIPMLTMDILKERIRSDRESDDPYYIYILFDGNEIAACSSVYVEISEKTVLNHNGALTAVNPKYRGKNLAKYLKARMYLKIFEDFKNIDAFYTDTYPVNSHMYSINEELGFKPYRTEKSYSIAKDFIRSLK